MVTVSTVVDLESDHCQAICEEIGARLRWALPPDSSALPPAIAELIDRLARQDTTESQWLVAA
jgi:hypothetical protein